MTNLIKDDKVVALEFSMLVSNGKKQASDVLNHFLLFLVKHDKRKNL
jgi:hypothetical protein